MVVVVQRRLLVRDVGGMRRVQRRQMVVPPGELRRDDVLEVLQESRRLEAGIFQLWREQIQDAAVLCLVEFKNIKCDSLDSEFDAFEYCLLKSVNRSYKYLSLKVKLYKVPITKVNFALLKKFNGYKPFLYNITVDACKTLRNPKSNPIFGYFHDAFKTFSNMNHTCPFDHDLIVDKLNIKHMDKNIKNIFLLIVQIFFFGYVSYN
ncbi:uncharacterized protein Dana_GF23304 [Drosophila ananassae]|uniref:Uncharacterized protein n=1 Tax=Drosophila ananassae TaxID=7217 RepID=B3MT68_DROAN|nr:uncharacterized protein Dana_GF23304 [Drosophila ananassae]